MKLIKALLVFLISNNSAEIKNMLNTSLTDVIPPKEVVEAITYNN